MVASDLLRAWHTAGAIAAALAAVPRAETRLRETHLGSWQGRTWADIEADAVPGDAAACARWRSDPDAPAPGGGEAVRTRFARVAAALHEAALVAAATTGKGAGATTATAPANAADGAAVLIVVAHGGVIDDIGRLVLGTPYGASTRLTKPNCAVCELRFAPHSAALAAVAALGHAQAPEAAAALVATSAAFDAATIEPAQARDALGAWRVVAWGITEHLADDEGAPRSDPLADCPSFAGASAAHT